MTQPITALSATELSRAIHGRHVSCVEVMTAFLDRIEALNPRFNAIISMQPREGLIQQATRADQELAQGRSRGWLHGMPQAPKDLTETAGIATVKGSAALRENVPQADSILAARMRGAGAIFIGKTNTPEFGLGSHTYNPVFGATGNAWDPALSAGGSSGGAAVALATGMLAVADGSDMMGSLRNPAGWNNVYGFRPTQGLVPSGPAPERFLHSLATDGPMGRSVQDVAMMLSIQAGHDARDPLSLAGDGAAFAQPLAAPPRGLRIGWLGDLDGYLPTQPGVLDCCESALAHLRDLGCQVVALEPGFPMARLWECWLTLRHFLVAGNLGALYDNPRTRALLKPEAIWEVEGGRALTAAQVHAASVTRTQWYLHMLKLFGDVDMLALPTAQCFPFDAAQPWPRELAGRSMDSYHRWMEVVIGPTLAGLPVLAMPAGFGPQGLPMGLQLIGPPRGDLAVLELGHAYDLIQPHTARGNPLLA
ncbi:MAG: amidase [Paracoccus sp. (in: a-proteobacteria)]|uniref:amidase n=1 Tax=Paracoccus sp. TaxID=267 RepID=UPI0039E52771